MANQIIQLPLIAQTAEHQLRSEACVSPVHPNGFFKQQIRRVPAACYQLQNVVGDAARGADGRRMTQP